MRRRMLYLLQTMPLPPRDAVEQLREVIHSLDELATREAAAAAMPLFPFPFPIPVPVPVPVRPPKKQRGTR
ncbi:MAG: hypothetical protein ACRD2J_07455 [Thermoanaerobaculia bacterium]